ncbi:hypothetical protein PFWH6_2094 [Pseudomonas fluorescens WH6]|nr:hypothetical protein PFWH6_2094 [Pseudomonas fluorescens WH6]
MSIFVVVLGVTRAWPKRLRGQRMETAERSRQLPLTDNRTLINVSIFVFSATANLKPAT